ncbi:hypothetical protein TRV_05839 [Trichophyton verrucosum HKI 0517]|uniref:Ferric oxidoreductase domain-containing protein n=1 Tax=Trichophyton verrucosum (strain HKI 0517) TaxID=663202 RepID=D4DF93_TRIVH|nr:uncharacterized protein TRV_05839 [Trichophyton verrucosum HKI 0517]EFE39442.1 hypothetical protein TRV_05839 [Trichophyton verrucosum HKI 0517]
MPPRQLESFISSILGSESYSKSLAKRIDIPINSATTEEQLATSQLDPFSKASKYALGWVYFCIVLFVLTFLLRLYQIWGDKIRAALRKEELFSPGQTLSPKSDYELVTPSPANSHRAFFPATGPLVQPPKRDSALSSIGWVNNSIAFARWIFYRPLPVIKLGKLEIVPPSLAAAVLVLLAFIFVTLYCFLPQPLYYPHITDGSPPLAIRAGMLAVATLPWIIALSTKPNIISVFTGIGHERLNVLHRWTGYLCLFLALVHMVPFYITPVWEDGALPLFSLFIGGDYYIY